MHFASVAVMAAGLMSCSPIVDYRGYLPKGEDMQKIQSGMSKTEVEAILGSPSTTATISTSGDSYYYISSTIEQTAFFQPKVVDRQIFAVRFDRDDRVEKFANYGLEDGIIVDFISRETPTRGKELGILQQLFQNLGRFDPG
jgi:outer membrane protein assembly factor BamE (lipoprotein component of BamABCDE complex)